MWGGGNWGYLNQQLAPTPPPQSPWDQFWGHLPQPWDVFGGGQQPSAPLYQPGWGDVFQGLLPWNQMPGPPAPTPNYLDDPAQWPPGRIPFGSRF